MANPTPVTTIVLMPSQQRQMQKVGSARGENQRENARWWRKRIMNAMSVVGLNDQAKVANGMHVASVQVESQEVHDNVTYFRLRVCGASGAQWHVLRRFSEFVCLRKQLGVRNHRVGTIFPQKTWFTMVNTALFHRKQREGLLQIWIDGLLREFATGGDGCNSLIATRWTSKLMTLNHFFGVDSNGRLLAHARLAQAAPAIVQAAPEASALAEAGLAIEDAAPVHSTLAPSAWAAASAPLLVAVAVPVLAPAALEAVADAALAEVPVARTADEEDEEFRAALAASVASHAEEQARQKVMEEARLAAEEEESRSNAKAALERMAAEAEESRRSAQLAAEESRRSAQLAAEEEAARVIAERAEAKRIKNAEMLAKRREMEQEIQARRKADEEEARRKAEEEDAKRKVEEEETRRKAEEQARKPWLEQASDLAGLARHLEEQGHTEQALDLYKKCIAMLMTAWKKETSEKVKGAIQEKVADMMRRTKELTAVIEAAEVAEMLSVPVPVGSPVAASLESRVDTPVAAPIVTVTTSEPAPTPVARIAVAS